MKTVMSLAGIILASVTMFAHVWPSGGALEHPLMPGERITITWDDALEAGLLDIELWDGERGTSTTLGKSIDASLHKFEWLIPDDQPRGLYFRFVVRNTLRPTIAVFSMGFSSIDPQRTLVSSIDSDAPTAPSVNISPVPANNELQLVWNTEDVVSIEVQDVSGRSYLRQTVDPTTRTLHLDVGAVPNGIYALVSRTRHGVTNTQPFVIRR